jgi:hypothetical protein
MNNGPRLCVCKARFWLLVVGIWLNRGQMRERRADEYAAKNGFWFLVISIWLNQGQKKAKAQPRAAVPDECCKGSQDR